MPKLDDLLLNDRGFVFGTRVSLDGVGDAHEDIRRVWHAFERAMDTVRAMQELQKKKFFNFGVSFTFTAQNLEEGERIYELCKKDDLNVVFSIARYSELAFGNMDLVASTELKKEDFPRLASFFRRRVRESGLVDGDALLYQGHPYAHYVGGTVQGLKAITLDDVKAHVQRVFTQDRLVIGLAGFNFQLTLAVMAKNVFGTGAQQFGLLTTALAAGALAAALVSGARRTRPSIYAVAGSAAAFGLLEMLAGLAPTFWTTAVMLVPTGFFMIYFAQATNQRIQLGTAIGLLKILRKSDKFFRTSIKTLVSALEMRTPPNAGQSERVATYCLAVAKELGLGTHDLRSAWLAGMLHNIGTIPMSDRELEHRQQAGDRTSH